MFLKAIIRSMMARQMCFTDLRGQKSKYLFYHIESQTEVPLKMY